MSITSIKLDGGISDPEFVEISANARKHERAHLLGLLRIYVGQLKKESGDLRDWSGVFRAINREDRPVVLSDH
jgi:hypothetical protein